MSVMHKNNNYTYNDNKYNMPHYFGLQLPCFLINFYNFYNSFINGNRNKYSTKYKLT